jgi:hypothetical protein
LESKIIKEKCLGAITSEKPKQDGRNRLKSPVFEIFIIANIELEILPFFVFYRLKLHAPFINGGNGTALYRQ